MRPRVFPAEDSERRSETRRRRIASMRPRVFPAEDAYSDQRRSAPSPGFNEAAGIPRGRQGPAWAAGPRWLPLQ